MSRPFKNYLSIDGNYELKLYITPNEDIECEINLVYLEIMITVQKIQRQICIISYTEYLYMLFNQFTILR